jgi:LmbE family N-acetylglucosaminyl deacetylase
MLPFALPPGPLTMLCLGAHADDIEIGCGGTILRWLAEHPGSTVWWVVFSADAARRREAEASAAELLAGAADARVVVLDHRDGCLPAERVSLKERFERLKRDLGPGPDVIFTHFRDDRHQDHRTVSDLTWETFRHHLVLEFEVPKYDGDLGSPNLFVELPEPVLRRKLAHLLQAFPSQRERSAFTGETFRALMRLRGLEAAASGGYAEGFYLRKGRVGQAS